MKLSTVADGVWGAVLMSIMIILHPVLRRWHLRWGATDEEASMALPGDPEPDRVKVKVNATHAISIQATPEDIWPWIVQIGAGRGGFYSYDLLENLVGCKLRSADRIHSEFQSLKLGDGVSLHPTAPPLEVRILIPNQSLVLGESWGFHLIPDPANARTTRLVIRARGGYEPRLKNRFLNFVAWHLFYEPVHFVMERRMLQRMKALVENVQKRSHRAERPPRRA